LSSRPHATGSNFNDPRAIPSICPSNGVKWTCEMTILSLGLFVDHSFLLFLLSSPAPSSLLPSPPAPSPVSRPPLRPQLHATARPAHTPLPDRPRTRPEPDLHVSHRRQEQSLPACAYDGKSRADPWWSGRLSYALARSDTPAVVGAELALGSLAKISCARSPRLSR
jgi:hypothetical protein